MPTASQVRPSYKAGFARSAGESACPELWDGLEDALVWGLGSTGLMVPNLIVGDMPSITGATGADAWTVNTNGPAMVNDGSDNQVIPRTSLEFGASGSVTYCGTFNPGSASYIFDTTGSNRCLLYCKNGSNQWGFYLFGTKVYDSNALGTYFQNGPAVFTVTWKPGAQETYYEGENVDSRTVSVTPGVQGNWVLFSRNNNIQYWDGSSNLILRHSRALSESEHRILARDYLAPFRLRRRTVGFVAAAGATATVAGTIITSAPTEADMRDTGGYTIIVTLVGGATFKAAGTGPIGSTADTNAFLAEISAATTPANGWNNEVRDNLDSSDITRNSSTVATITLPVTIVNYDIDADETITVTVPTDVLDSGGPITAAPTFDITAIAANTRRYSLPLSGVG